MFYKSRWLILVALATLVSLSLAGVVGASSSLRPSAPGDLDPNFGRSGLVRTDFPLAVSASVQDMARQADGKIVTVGADAADFGLLRFNADGTPDDIFRDAVNAAPTSTGEKPSGAALVIQPDGKIIAAGTINIYSSFGFQDDFILGRYNSDGSLDPSFGGTGFVLTDFAGGNDDLHKLLLQSDGKVVAIGRSRADFALARYNTDGSLDASFGTGGKVTLTFGPTSEEFAGDAALLTNGDVVVVGGSTTRVDSDYIYSFALAAFRPDGSPDPAFGSGGKVLTTRDDARLLATAVALTTSGEIVIGGSNGASTSASAFTLARYHANGQLDSGFGTNGLVETSFGLLADIHGLAVQPDNKIVAVGTANSGPTLDFGLARYKPNGTLDNTFSGDGKQVTAFGPDIDEATSVIVLSDGRLLVGGGASQQDGSKLALGLYSSSGELVPTFGAGGKVLATGRQQGNNGATAVALTADGKIIAAGYAETATCITPVTCSTGDFALARYLPDGSLDRTFGVRGRATAGIVGGAMILDIALQPDGKIVAAGNIGGFVLGDFMLARFNADGSLDHSFGQAGVVQTDFGYGDHATAVVVQADGKIVAGGSSTHGDVASDYALARYNVDGTLDGSFGVGGKVLTDFDGAFDEANALVLQPDGKLIAAGYSGTFRTPQSDDFSLVRYNIDGSLDASFGVRGKVRTDFAEHFDQISAMQLQPDGRIVVAGRTLPAANAAPEFGFARYTAAGLLDPSFDSDGKRHVAVGGIDAQVTALQLQADGALVAAGRIARPCGQECFDYDFGLIRLLADGSTDISFGGGLISTDFGGRGDLVNDLAIASDGKIVVVGENGDFLLARYQVSAQPDPTFTPTATPVPATPTIGPGCLLSDVCPGDYWFAPVQELMRRGAISGYNDNTFRPTNNTTRSQLAKIVVLAEALPVITPGTATFSDVPTDNPFFSFIETAAHASIVSGYADGSFKPYNNVTRGQLSKIVAVAEGWTAGNPAQPTFNDVPRNNTFFGFIEAAYAHGVISGYGDGTFRWSNNATRAQIAKIVYLAVTGAAQK